MEDLENESDTSSLWKYCLIQHEGRIVLFGLDALRTIRYPMVRQVNEGGRVRLSEFDICMNLKSELHQPGIVRVAAVRGSVNEKQTCVVFPAQKGEGTRGRGRARRGFSRGAGTRNQEPVALGRSTK